MAGKGLRRSSMKFPGRYKRATRHLESHFVSYVVNIWRPMITFSSSVVTPTLYGRPLSAEKLASSGLPPPGSSSSLGQPQNLRKGGLQQPTSYGEKGTTVSLTASSSSPCNQ